jgi:hypothetical protein
MSIDLKDTLFNITEKYKEATELLISLGFDSLKDDNLRKMFGSSISLENALKSKKINSDEFVARLIERIEENKEAQKKYKDTIRITGVLPSFSVFFFLSTHPCLREKQQELCQALNTDRLDLQDYIQKNLRYIFEFRLYLQINFLICTFLRGSCQKISRNRQI